MKQLEEYRENEVAIDHRIYNLRDFKVSGITDDGKKFEIVVLNKEGNQELPIPTEYAIDQEENLTSCRFVLKMDGENTVLVKDVVLPSLDYSNSGELCMNVRRYVEDDQRNACLD